MARAATVTPVDAAYLRRESLEWVLGCLAFVLYLWCLVLFHSGSRFGPAWLGLVLLALGVGVALALRERNVPLASAALVAGVIAADLHAMWLSGVRVAPYLLAVAVSLAGLLFSMQAVIWVTLACVGAVLALGTLGLGYPVRSIDLLAPVLVIGAVGTLSALWVRNLYLTLYWAYERAVAAQRNWDELRDRRGELARTAKALDEACQRLEHMNYDLSQARAAAEDARAAKQRFASSVSHELRTPLNVIVAFAEMMHLSPQSYGGVPLPPQYRGDVQAIYRSSQALLHLIDDVLDLSQVEAQQLKLHLEPANLADVIAEAVDMMRPLVRSKDVELRTEIADDLPVMPIDRGRISQVLINLLNNARRFTQRGSITVRALVEGQEVKVTVADTGSGIAPGNHDSIFDEFRQVDEAPGHERNGVGLGLAISRRFVELHGGRIWVESEGIPGRGSQFHFRLPLAGAGRAQYAALQSTPLALAQPQGRGRVLLVMGCDSSAIRMLEQGLLDYQLVPVADVAGLPEMQASLHPRALLLNTAGCPGPWQTAEGPRELPDTKGLPIVLCPIVGERQMAQAMGVAGYLVKPIARNTLVQLLEGLGGSVHGILIVDDDPNITRVLTRMIRSAGGQYDVRRSHTGRQALQEMRHTRPDLVLLDLAMPGMDGHEVLAEMRRDADLRQVRVVVVTAQDRSPEEERRLGGRYLAVASPENLTNREALHLLHGLLDRLGPPPLLAAGVEPAEG